LRDRNRLSHCSRAAGVGVAEIHALAAHAGETPAPDLTDETALPVALFAIGTDLVVAGSILAGKILHRLRGFEHDEHIGLQRVGDGLDRRKSVGVGVRFVRD
jgi:hypothetical protein